MGTGNLPFRGYAGWRTAGTTIIQWEPFVLPPEQEEKTERLMHLLARYSAACC